MASRHRYAAEHARGGVLEPAGIAEIKFRKPELVKAMHRMDKQLKWMSMNEATGMVRPEDVASRETELLPSYQVRPFLHPASYILHHILYLTTSLLLLPLHSLVLTRGAPPPSSLAQPLGEIFCDLHDRPERMLAKGVIRDIVLWKDSRKYFYWRIKRKFEELRLTGGLTAAGKATTHPAALKMVEAAVPATTADQAAYEALAKLDAASM